MAGLLCARRAEVVATKGGENRPRDWRHVDVHSLKSVRPRTVGVEHVGLWAMQQVGLPDLFEQLEFRRSVRDAATGSIIGRLAQPASEHATQSWLAKSSGLDEFVGGSYEQMGSMQLYRASDMLIRHQEAMEEHLFDRAVDLFDLTPTVTLYDLTNTFFEGSASGIDKARHGHSKEKRFDCPLLTLALVVDASGFVRRSKVFKGNVREDCTLAEMLEALKTPRGARVVMDRGIATEERIQWLREHGYRYVVVSRQRKRIFDSEAAQTIKTAAGDNLELYREASEDEVRLYCKSKPRAEIERAITAKRAKSFEEALQELSDGLLRPKTHKRLDWVWERIGRMKERFGGIGQHYEIKVQPDDSGTRAASR